MRCGGPDCWARRAAAAGRRRWDGRAGHGPVRPRPAVRAGGQVVLRGPRAECGPGFLPGQRAAAEVEFLQVAQGRSDHPVLRYAEQSHDVLAVQGHRYAGQPLVLGTLRGGALRLFALRPHTLAPRVVVRHVVGLQGGAPPVLLVPAPAEPHFQEQVPVLRRSGAGRGHPQPGEHRIDRPVPP
ncbi:hypothetical protein ADL29_26345 [Streptomyces chattanoogensis]|uniref:Uncharacterized protein n=1 Tax=Streptomyces chattanoogensis TaxID=66876 RepID=A0A0N0GXW8_9ACTN|nr:hypothetical protein ADL29_26345 [Streptomyces chattanoogensis]